LCINTEIMTPLKQTTFMLLIAFAKLSIRAHLHIMASYKNQPVFIKKKAPFAGAF
jgi:hypothetical protein